MANRSNLLFSKDKTVVKVVWQIAVIEELDLVKSQRHQAAESVETGQLQSLPVKQHHVELGKTGINWCIAPPDPIPAGPRIWNSLPCGLRTLDISYKHFKTLLKTYV